MKQKHPISFPCQTTHRVQRISHRFTPKNVVAVTRLDAAKTLSLSMHGISFGCLYSHIFNEQLCIAILAAESMFIKEKQLKILWSNRNYFRYFNNEFELVVGGVFVNLNQQQQSKIDPLLKKLHFRPRILISKIAPGALGRHDRRKFQEFWLEIK